MKCVPIKAFSDNYIWCIEQKEESRAVVVDPGDAAPVLKYLNGQELSLSAILITHHHSDHTGGIAKLKLEFPDIRIYGPEKESIAGLTHLLKEGDVVDLAEQGLEFQVLDVPGHTQGHIAYYGHGALFCGDTLFACGCGRVFDGTLDELASSLQRLASLPEETFVYCAHEYTVDNIGFAKWVEPENADLLDRDRQAMSDVDSGIPTVPSRLSLELVTNPFLRCQEPEVIARALERKSGIRTYAEVFAELRRWKDQEYD